MANAIQRSISDKSRRALRRFTPDVCRDAWNAWSDEEYNYYEVGALLGLHPHQARSAVDAWGEVRRAAKAHGIDEAAVVQHVAPPQGCVGACARSSAGRRLCPAGTCKRRK